MQQDLTQGSISKQLIGMAAFIGLGLLFQTLYFLIDLYFVGSVGPDALAGVGLAGVVFFLVMAAAQMVSVGSLSLIARAIGGKDFSKVDGVYRQSMLLSVGLFLLTLALGYGLGGRAIDALAADVATAEQGKAYLYGFLPALALMFPTGAMGAALRAAGVVRPTMLVQTGTVLLNAVLAPVLIAGWGSGLPLGAFGAGLASSIAAGAGFLGSVWLFGRVQTLMRAPLRLDRPRDPDADCRHRPALGGRVPAHVRHHGRGLCRDPQFRQRGPGRLRGRVACDAGDLPAGDGHLLRGRAGRRPEFRRGPAGSGPQDRP
jgi:Na+-driven multidrug efflux pump